MALATLISVIAQPASTATATATLALALAVASTFWLACIKCFHLKWIKSKLSKNLLFFVEVVVVCASGTWETFFCKIFRALMRTVDLFIIKFIRHLWLAENTCHYLFIWTALCYCIWIARLALLFTILTASINQAAKQLWIANWMQGVGAVGPHSLLTHFVD